MWPIILNLFNRLKISNDKSFEILKNDTNYILKKNTYVAQSITYTQSGNFYFSPDDDRTGFIIITLLGGGGGGGGQNGGGGGGASCFYGLVSNLTLVNAILISVGSGGTGGSVYGNGSTGGTTQADFILKNGRAISIKSKGGIGGEWNKGSGGYFGNVEASESVYVYAFHDDFCIQLFDWGNVINGGNGGNGGSSATNGDNVTYPIKGLLNLGFVTYTGGIAGWGSGGGGASAYGSGGNGGNANNPPIGGNGIGYGSGGGGGGAPYNGGPGGDGAPGLAKIIRFKYF